jgi:cell division protein FtsL
MAARRVTPQPRRRGRTTLALVLIGFLIVTVSVIARRSAGRALQRDLTTIERTRTQLSGETIKLEADIRSASSRNRLAPLVEASLGMRVPSDTQVIDLQVTEVPRVTP